MSMDGYSPEYEKENQDFSKYYSFTTNKVITNLFMLADGHGPIGHTASATAIDLLSHKLEQKFADHAETVITDDFIKKALADSFEEIQLKFKSDSENAYKYSGTTMVCALIRKNVLYLASVGDSKGFLASKNGSSIVPSLVTKDHKPDVEEEKDRILKAGGMIGPYLDADKQPNGPNRVWNKAMTEPGLATSRTLGDISGHNFGVSHVPGSPN